VVFGILTVPAVFLAGRELFGRLAGVTAALMVAAAQFQIHYSHEARMYSVFALFGALSLYLMLLHLRRPSRITAIAFVLATATMLYTHFYGLLTLAVEGLYVLGLLLVRRAGTRQMVHWILLFAAAGSLFLPWAYFVVRQTYYVQQGFWIAKPTYDGTLEYFRVFAGGTKLVLAELALIFLALMLALQPPRLPVDDPAAGGILLTYRERIVLLAIWLLFPIVVAYGLSFVLQPFLMVRYVIAASLAWYILAATGVSIIARENVLAAIAVALILVLSQGTALRVYYRDHHRGDWRGAFAYVLANTRPGDAVIANPILNKRPAMYYLRKDPLPIGVYNGEDFGIVDTATRVWVVTDMWDECFSGAPGLLAARRPVIEHRKYYKAALCLYGPLKAAGG